MGKIATGTVSPEIGPPIDWPTWKAEVIAKLDVAAEYAALGVEFTKPEANSKGIRECRAFGREDKEPSAFVNVRTGVYHDSGGEGLSTDLFNFALRHGSGRWGKWVEVARHYGERAGVPLGHISYGAKGRILEQVYSYHDADGQLIYGVHRLRLPNGDKTFRQYPWRDGGWFKAEGCMDGVSLCLYRLPELLAAPIDEPIWIVEGEKDVDRLVALEFVATCNPMGAGKWRPWFSEHLKGRTCYVVPDNDPTGRAHAESVAASLREHGAASVKIVDLPGLTYHGDLSDWLDAGNPVDELGRLAYAAAEWSADPNKPATEVDLSRDATVADIRDLQSSETWVWRHWIPAAALTLVAAEPGTGKTRFCFDLARRIFHGIHWPDGSPATLPMESKTLWIVADNQWQEMCDIPATFGIPDSHVILNASAADPYSGTSLQTEEEFADLEARIRRVNPALVIIDTITNTSDLKSQDSADAKRQYKPLQEIATRTQTAIICVTHLNASGKVLGRRAMEKVRVAIQLSCPDPDSQPYRRKLWVEKSKAIKPRALGVTMGDDGNEYDDCPPEAPAEPARINGARTGPPPAKTVECANWLAKRLAIGQARVSVIRREAEQAGHSTGTLYKARDHLRVIEEEIDGYKWWRLSNNQENGHVPY